jgi:hypothetical protein
MSRAIYPLVAASALVLLGASCSRGQSGCERNEDCPSGKACAPDRRCFPAAPLSISTTRLAGARVAEVYSEPLVAEGGIPPYRWALKAEPPLGWLRIDSASGHLSNQPTQLPDKPVPERAITVTVRDHSNAGDGQEQSVQLPFAVRACSGESFTCWVADAGACFEGTAACLDGQPQACKIKTPSTIFEHCGVSAGIYCGECSTMKDDRCAGGKCQCGSEPTCTPPKKCCAAHCVDQSRDVKHCGGCDVACPAGQKCVPSATGGGRCGP